MRNPRQMFKKYAEDPFFWPNSLADRRHLRPLQARYLQYWTKLQGWLIYWLRIKTPLREIKTFWGESMTMFLPHPTFLCFYGILGRNETFLTEFMLNHVQRGDIFIDGGANIGYYSLLAAALVGNQGSVYSFEPTPTVFSVLKKNTAKYHFIHAESMLLWKEQTTLEFTDFGRRHSLYNSISGTVTFDMRLQHKESVHRLHVSATTLDRYCKEHQIRPTFIKLDTEGSERQIIEGAVEILQHAKPIVTIEVWKQTVGNGDFRIIFERLAANGYYCYQLREKGKMIAITNSDQPFDTSFFNLVFMPQGQTPNQNASKRI